MSYGGRLEAFFTVPSGSTVAATNSGGTGTSVSLTAGSYTPTSFAAHLQTRLNAVRTPATWTVAVSTGSSGTGKCTIDCVGETYALTFTTAAAGTALGYAGNISSTTDPSVSDYSCRGLWLPKCPLMIAGHPSAAPEVTDARSTYGPTGKGLTLKGTSMYRHRGLRWSHVANAQYREAAASVTYSSLEQWVRDTQWGDGHSWFTPGSAFQIYWSNNGTDELVGLDLNSGSGPTYGWTAQPAISTLELEPRTEGLLSYFSFAIPAIVSEG